jgi:hypothetical protein
MIFRTALLLTLIGLMSAAALGDSQTPDISFDKRIDFGKYKTYIWSTGTPAPNPLTDQRIIAGVDARLAAIGWQKVASDADVMVIYHVSLDPQTKITSYSVGGPYNGYQWGMYDYYGDFLAGGTVGAGAPTDKIQTLLVGELLIDMAEVKTKNFMWRGAAKDTIKDRDPNKIKKKVEKAIKALFKDFPPGSKKN